MKSIKWTVTLCLLTLPLLAAEQPQPAPPSTGEKKEKPVNFVPAKADPLMGDWQGDQAGCVAQVLPLGQGEYRANLLSAFDQPDNVLAVLRGSITPGGLELTGDGWIGTIKDSTLTATQKDRTFKLRHTVRVSPTMGAPPPDGAVVLFDGRNLDAWAKKAGKNWLMEEGPAQWKLVEGGAVEAVPGADCIITHRKFGDCRVHVEFRTLGAPSNSGVFLEDRYEVNINETYGHTTGGPNGGFDNCTDHAEPRIRPCFPPLAWQTFDITFVAPRFDAEGHKTSNAVATVLFNGVKIYDHQPLDLPHGAARRLGEAPTGPLMLQEHGMPVQFRNIWLVETPK